NHEGELGEGEVYESTLEKLVFAAPQETRYYVDRNHVAASSRPSSHSRRESRTGSSGSQRHRPRRSAMLHTAASRSTSSDCPVRLLSTKALASQSRTSSPCCDRIRLASATCIWRLRSHAAGPSASDSVASSRSVQCLACSMPPHNAHMDRRFSAHRADGRSAHRQWSSLICGEGCAAHNHRQSGPISRSAPPGAERC